MIIDIDNFVGNQGQCQNCLILESCVCMYTCCRDNMHIIYLGVSSLEGQINYLSHLLFDQIFRSLPKYFSHLDLDTKFGVNKD